MTFQYPERWPKGDYPGRAEDGVFRMQTGDARDAVQRFNSGSYSGIVINYTYGARGLDNLDFLLDFDPERLRHVHVLTGVPDDSSVERLTGLESLSLATRSRRRLELGAHANLRQLSIEGERVPKTGLAHLGLRSLSVTNYQDTDWTRLPATLQYTKLSWRRLATLDGLENLDLRALDLAYVTRVDDWTMLATQRGLRVLELHGVKTKTLSWLHGMPNLRYLVLENCGPVQGYDALARSSTNLKLLSVTRGTVVVDAPSLATLDDLSQAVWMRHGNWKGHLGDEEPITEP